MWDFLIVADCCGLWFVPSACKGFSHSNNTSHQEPEHSSVDTAVLQRHYPRRPPPILLCDPGPGQWPGQWGQCKLVKWNQMITPFFHFSLRGHHWINGCKKVLMNYEGLVFLIRLFIKDSCESLIFLTSYNNVLTGQN